MQLATLTVGLFSQWKTTADHLFAESVVQAVYANAALIIVRPISWLSAGIQPGSAAILAAWLAGCWRFQGHPERTWSKR